jgi:hypothetical protein
MLMSAAEKMSELVTAADRSTGRPAANEAAIFRNDVNDAVAHAAGDSRSR